MNKILSDKDPIVLVGKYQQKARVAIKKIVEDTCIFGYTGIRPEELENMFTSIKVELSILEKAYKKQQRLTNKPGMMTLEQEEAYRNKIQADLERRGNNE